MNSTSPLSPMAWTPDRKQEALHTLQQVIQLIESIPEARSCPTCEQFASIANPWCHYWDAEVPKTAQPQGRDQWQPQIPF